MLKKGWFIRHSFKTIRSLFFRFFGNNRFRKIGSNNHIRISKYCLFKECRVIIKGTNNTVIFGEDCNLRGLEIYISGVGNLVSFGNNVVVNASSIKPTVINCIGGHKIIIGKGSLFSNSIRILNTDHHGIYNLKGERINPEKDITIGESVWVGLDAKILKGTEISDNSIVGCGSIVSGSFLEKNVIIAGIPARVIKSEVFWNHSREINCPLPEVL